MMLSLRSVLSKKKEKKMTALKIIDSLSKITDDLKNATLNNILDYP